MTTKKVDEPRVTDVEALVRENLAETRGRFVRYRTTLKKESDLMPEATDMHQEDRVTTNGRLATDEPPALRTLLDVIDAYQSVFASLAAKDHGRDPNRVETTPARNALDLLDELVPLVDELEAAHRRASDLMLRLGELARSVTTPAYAIANANAPLNPALRAAMAPVNDYYRGRVARSRTRKTADPTK